MEVDAKIIPLEDRVAIAEVDYIIHHMNDMYLNKIPQKVRDYITILKKKDTNIYIDPKIPLEQQGLKEFTLYFLMILNLKYWCDDERRKDILAMLEENQKKYDEKIKNINNIVEQAENIKTDSEVTENINNKPKKVIVVNSSDVRKLNENVENAQISKEIEKETLKEEAIVPKNKENFFSKIINKLKSIIKKK